MNNLNGLYIVTEGEFNKNLVEMLIPEQYQDKVSVLATNGYSDALSLTRSLLSARHQSNTILVVDANSTNDDNIEERKDFITSYMNRVSGNDRFAILLQKPAIEVAFFEDKTALETLTGKGYTDLEFRLAKDNPKKNFLDFLSINIGDKKDVLDRVSADEKLKKELRGSQLSRMLSKAIQRFLN